MRRVVRVLGVAGILLASAAAASAESVIIKCARPCTAVIQAIERSGGTVTHRYKYVDAIAAEVTSAALSAVRRVVESGAVRKDRIVAVPTTVTDRNGTPMSVDAQAASAEPLSAAGVVGLATADPNGYRVNNVSLNLGSLHGGGVLGQDMKVAVIDSGIRPGFPHISLDGSVIGGENLVPDALGFSNVSNNGHGTFVAGMISANVLFNFDPMSPVRNSVAANCPACMGPGPNQIAMIGAAPASSIYALRVFAPTGGSPESRIIAAMERVLTLRENYDKGMLETQNENLSYDALNIRVCNMSLGGPTLYAGRDIEDQLTEAFLEKDIVLVTSAGNAGPAGSTGGSPGTGFGSLTVGASSSPLHERVLRDVQYGLGIGPLYRPFNGVQTAFFSSRGPTADGRVDPDVIANGFASFGQGFGATAGSLNLASGTSFSAPTVAGVAALLRQAVPAATAREVRNALILSANPVQVADGSGPLDMGAGHVNGGAALALLQTWTTPDTPGEAGGTNKHVMNNIRHGADVHTFNGSVVRSVQGLKPGERFETFYRVAKDTSEIVVTVSDVTPGASQNALFGRDSILLTVHSAKTSAIGEGDYDVFAFTVGGTFTIPNPDLGLMRVTLNGDWTNASPIGATVAITSGRTITPGKSAQKKIVEGQFYAYPFTVAPDTARLEVQLEWDGDWGAYPTNDLDVILFPPSGPVNGTGATLNVPELAVIDNPVAGPWVAIVDGFSVASKNGDRFDLRIAADGKVLKVK